MKSLMNKLKISTKLNLAFISIIIVFAVVVGIVVQSQVTSGVKGSAAEKAANDLELANYMLNYYYPGEWEIIGGELHKGDESIYENFEIADHIGETIGGLVTVFQHRQPITTNLLIEGERAISSEATGQVVDVVLTEGNNLYGEADVLGTDMQTGYMPIMDINGEVIGMIFVGASQEFINETVSGVMKVVFIVLAVIITFGVLMFYLISKKMARRLESLNKVMLKAGEGDFTADVKDDSRDEIGQLAAGFTKMKKDLKALIQQVAGTSEHLAASSEQLAASAEETNKATGDISDSVQQVASGSEQQADSTKNVQGIVSDITSGMEEIASYIQTVSQSSVQSAEKAEQGSGVIVETVSQMNKIQEKTSSTAAIIEQLGSKSDKIGEIVSLITDVADQTNLLALNAAIEAARAGEHGKGFAVVADEVRKLAEQSRDSAQQISSVIRGIQEDIDESVVSMGEGRTAVSEGIGYVNKAGSTFQDLIQDINLVSTQVEEVSASVQEISAGAGAMVTAIQETSEISEASAGYTQNVAAAVEEQTASIDEISAAAETLAGLAEKLQCTVKNFKM
ncbi:methyl-accepting chemotaxis protein [Evansella clarkii]|uniref:methyl-accepting chemotaxis protein n=1 Tax=Evansella clarkii TaxID=79879 RepID=UPI001FD3BC7B|nr:methyl-accepting chemotaxis protein [Evansella clarkii]